MMSNKNTPQKVNDFKSSIWRPDAKKGTSFLTKKMVIRTRQTQLKKKNEQANNEIEIASCNETVGAPQFKTNATALNACYTPSSLYRNTKTTSRIHMCTPGNRKVALKTGSIADIVTSEEISNMTVAVRVRPLNAQECKRESATNICVHSNSNEITVRAGASADDYDGVTHFFSYDHVFYSCDTKSGIFATQKNVFEGTALPLIERAFEGYNTCLFAYGQTGSGKSYSMMGIEAFDDAALDGNAPHTEAGIIPRVCHELFERIDAVKHQMHAEIEVNYFEIYNEKIHDLLSVQEPKLGDGVQRQALKVREHPIWGPYVVDLSVHSVDSYAALRNWLSVGNSQRATAATALNDKSSRSHSIFNIIVNLTEIDSDSTSTDTNCGMAPSNAKQTKRSKISLVDLAGSERSSVYGSNGDRIREGVSINKSLLTLGKVIAALSDSKKCGSTFVPYRESVLTWLLRENLGGNSKTVMLATISPTSLHIDETLATLRYACKARAIVNKVKVNESPHDKIIRDLRAEVERLKSLQNDFERQRRLSANSNINSTPRKVMIEQVEALRQQLSERERELCRAQKSWTDRLKEAENQRKSEMRMLKRKGLALELASEQTQACLINLTADPILSGTLFYILPPGAIKIGRARTSTHCNQPDIVLEGPLVAYNHCIIENNDGKLIVTPENDGFETFVNGKLLDRHQRLYHGDRLVIGGSHYFRISNPVCIRHGKDILVDFQLAHQEILHTQEKKLRRELEEEKRLALSHIEKERAEHERDFNERLESLELEQFKFKCNRELLETERKALDEENAGKLSEYMPSFKSTLLEDINRIMLNPSEESLHKTQLMVKEATQRCRSFGLKFEFRQYQEVDEFGMLRTVILLLDKQNSRKAEWPIARLRVWLDMLRDTCDIPTVENVFTCVETEWQSLNADFNESLNGSLSSRGRIPFRLSVMKGTILEEPLKKFIDHNRKEKETNSLNMASNPVERIASPWLESKLSPVDTNKNLLFENGILPESSNSIQQLHVIRTTASFVTIAASEMRFMQRSTLRMKMLCDCVMKELENLSAVHSGLVIELSDGLNRIEAIMNDMQNCLQHHLSSMAKKSTTKTL